jgi:hypothetical protein
MNSQESTSIRENHILIIMEEVNIAHKFIQNMKGTQLMDFYVVFSLHHCQDAVAGFYSIAHHTNLNMTCFLSFHVVHCIMYHDYSFLLMMLHI